MSDEQLIKSSHIQISYSSQQNQEETFLDYFYCKVVVRLTHSSFLTSNLLFCHHVFCSIIMLSITIEIKATELIV